MKLTRGVQIIYRDIPGFVSSMEEETVNVRFWGYEHIPVNLPSNYVIPKQTVDQNRVKEYYESLQTSK